MHILIIEDDSELAAAMAGYLELQGVICDFAYNGSTALKLAQDFNYDAIILDLMLPKLSGFEVCSQLRSSQVLTPILMLTASIVEEDQLTGFQVGIDDYVCKPSPMPIIWARIQAILRRERIQDDTLSLGDLTISFKQHRVSRQMKSIQLTPTEWKMLELIAKRSPQIVSRAEIERYVWGDSDVEQGNFNVHLHGLRKAVDKPFSYPMIETVINVGLRLSYQEQL